MKYIYITYEAIASIVSTHQLQSADFEAGIELCEILQGNLNKWKRGNLFFRSDEKGGYFYTSVSSHKQGMIFDLTTFKGFNNFKSGQVITIFQKLLKFAVRYFEKLPPSSCERHISGTSICLVFPFPFTATTESYRVIVEKNSENRRLSRRDKSFLIVYSDGMGEANSELISSLNLNRVIEAAPKACILENVNDEVDERVPAIESLKLTTLSGEIDLSLNANIGFDSWKHYLTKNQSEFIFKNVDGPERLEGAAGTGKTLTLILRSIYLLKEHERKQVPCKIIFITHSISSKKQIQEIFLANLTNGDQYFDDTHSVVSIKITTLQELCIELLGNYLGATEYLDRDAQDSKLIQKMYLDEAYTRAMRDEFATYKYFCSDDFLNYLELTEKEHLLDMIQHEVSVTIKGRANEKLEKYKMLPRLKYSIPCRSEGDLNFLFLIFTIYQESLGKVNQFDSDDIVLTALGQLDTPIWRRRKSVDGYNVLIVDETHLFNLNELSILHNLSKDDSQNNIIFSLDRSQAVGDRGLVDDVLHEALNIENRETRESSRLGTIFRSSPEIVNVAFNILCSGVTLFTSFENPMEKVAFSFIESNGKPAQIPKMIFRENDDEIVKEGFKSAESLRNEINTTNSKILIIVTSELLFSKFEKFAQVSNKPVQYLKSRGDFESVRLAERNNRFVIAAIDYVGGLEFDGVVICGVDKGRVPPNTSEGALDAYHYTSYAWHNRMYVAVTRAKYSLIFIGDSTRGKSPLLESSLLNGCVVEES